jgi:hypothetical protein
MARRGATRDREPPTERESRIRRGSGRRVTAARYRRPGPPGRASVARATILVFPAAEGNWSVDEQASGKSALSYFPTKLGAMRHAMQLAESAAPSEIRVLDDLGAVTGTRRYDAPADAPGARSARQRRTPAR